MKVFYKEIYEELLFLNGDSAETAMTLDRQCGNIKYGELPKNQTELIQSYDSLLSRIRRARKDRKDELRDLSIEKHFGKETVYSGSKGWVEEGMYGAGLIKRKAFWKVELTHTYVEVHPTLKDLVTTVPLDLVREYSKDNNLDLDKLVQKIIKYVK